MILWSVSSIRKRVSLLSVLALSVWLLTGTLANAQGDDLANAAKKGDLHRVERLLAKGADVNARSSTGGTALYGASFNGHLAIVQTLLAKGADVNCATQSGSHPLAAASQQGHLDIVQLRLEKGAQVNAKDSDGLTALYSASQAGQIEIVRALLAKGADVNLKTNFGQTPLKGATIQGHTDVAALLSQAGVQAGGTGDAPQDSSPKETTIVQPSATGPLPQDKFPLKSGEWETTFVNAKNKKTTTALYCLNDKTFVEALTKLWVGRFGGRCSTRFSISSTDIKSYEECSRIQTTRSNWGPIETGEQDRASIDIVFDGTTHFVKKVSIDSNLVTLSSPTHERHADYQEDYYWKSEVCSSNDVKVR